MNTEVEVGQTLDGRFHLTALLNRGGMSSIYKAQDFQSGRDVAVKVPFLRPDMDPGFFSRFDREEEIGRTLKHPCIPYVLPVRGKSRPYIVMEYLEGELLSDVIRNRGTFPVADALNLVARITDAVAFLHEHRIIHRDLKPQNIMLLRDGSLRIIDFGIAKILGSRKITRGPVSTLLGTPDYMAPEQVEGKPADQRTDIYSLGAVLYELVTGSVPFEGDNALAVMNARVIDNPAPPRKRNPAVPPTVEEIILHALERDPAHRYPTAKAFLSDLESPDGVPLTGRAERFLSASPRRRGCLGFGAGGFMLAGLAVVIPLAFLHWHLPETTGKGRSSASKMVLPADPIPRAIRPPPSPERLLIRHRKRSFQSRRRRALSA